MHDAISTPELLLLILQSSSLTRNDLRNAALTCHPWSRWALDVLWSRFVVPFRPIIELLGTLTPMKRSKCIFYCWDSTYRDISAEDWERFLRYTQRITHIKLENFALDKSVVYFLQHLTSEYERPVFPALSSVVIGVTLNLSLTASLLMVPALKSVELTCWEQRAGAIAYKIMRMVEATLSETEPKDLSFKVDDLVNPNFTHYPKLQRLSLEFLGWRQHHNGLSQILLHPISNLKELVTLELLSRPSPAESVVPSIAEFPSLRHLRMCGAAVAMYPINFIYAPQLEELALEQTSMNDDKIDVLISQCRTRYPNLIRFSFETVWEIRLATMRCILSLPKLRHLTLSSTYSQLDNYACSVELPPLVDKLETLRFQTSYSFGTRPPLEMGLAPSSFIALLEKAPHMKDLAMGLGNMSLVPLERTFPQLESLSISVPGEFKGDPWNEFAPKLAKLLPGLRSLDLIFRDGYYHVPGEDERAAMSVFWIHHDELRKRPAGWSIVSSH